MLNEIAETRRLRFSFFLNKFWLVMVMMMRLDLRIEWTDSNTLDWINRVSFLFSISEQRYEESDRKKS